MRRTLKSLIDEAAEHLIQVKMEPDRVCFYSATDSTNAIAWMHKIYGCVWTGFTSCEDASGRKRGSKIEVMDWCLDWAINGF